MLKDMMAGLDPKELIELALLLITVGALSAHAMSKRNLEMAFGAYMFIVGGRFVISLL